MMVGWSLLATLRTSQVIVLPRKCTYSAEVKNFSTIGALFFPTVKGAHRDAVGVEVIHTILIADIRRISFTSAHGQEQTSDRLSFAQITTSFERGVWAQTSHLPIFEV